MEKDTVIRFAGLGGQGILFAGKILARAALEAGRHPCFVPSYGAEKRGGPSECTVILSREELPCPCVTKSRAAAVMNEASLTREEQRLERNGLLVVNSSVCGEVKPSRPDVSIFLVPAGDLAQELGNDRVANVVMAGALVALLELFAPEDLTRGLEKVLAGKQNMLPVNLKALACGREFARKLNTQ